MTSATGSPATMRAVQYDHYGPPAVLAVRTANVPVPARGQVLIKVAATSVNAADVTIRRGALRLVTGRRFPRGAGFDFAGTIVDAGPGVTGWARGDAVWGFLPGIRQGPSGAAADYLVAPVSAVSAAPQSVDAVAAAALAGVGGSALVVLCDAAKLRPGERVLIRGGAGGVGSAAVQLARAIGGRVTALARAEHHDALRALGAEQTLDYRTLAPRALPRFDVIVDTVGRGLRPYRRLLAPGGRYLNMALGGPRDLAYLGASALFGGRRVRFVQAPPDGKVLADLAGFVDAGALVPVIAARYRLEEIGDAHRALEHGGSLGKYVVALAAPGHHTDTAAAVFANPMLKPAPPTPSS